MVLVCSVSPLFVLLTIVLCVPFHSLVILAVFLSHGFFVPCPTYGFQKHCSKHSQVVVISLHLCLGLL